MVHDDTREPPSATWVVVKATAPRWLTLQIPRQVAELIGLDARAAKAWRRIAFLDRGPGVVRVIALGGPASSAEKEPQLARTLAITTPSAGLLLKLPSAVRQHLGLRTLPRGLKRVQGTDDLVAWMVPEPELERVRQEGVGPGVHVYLTKSVFPAPRSWEESEPTD